MVHNPERQLWPVSKSSGNFPDGARASVRQQEAFSAALNESKNGNTKQGKRKKTGRRDRGSLSWVNNSTIGL